MKTFLATILLFLTYPGLAQDVTGIWRGYFNDNAYNKALEGTLLDDRYKFEVQLAQRQNQFDGVTYSYRSTVFYGKASAKGTVNPKTQKVLLDELKILEVRMAGESSACIMTCFLQYSKSGENEFLEGTYFSTNTRDSSSCGKGKIFLQKVTNSDFYKEPFVTTREKEIAKEKGNPPVVKKPAPSTTQPKATNSTVKTTTPTITKPKTGSTSSTTPKKPGPGNSTATTKPKNNPSGQPAAGTKPPAPPPNTSASIKPVLIDSVKKIDRKVEAIPTPKILASRENEVVKTITTSANEISIRVYDNGSIDNDTISVYIDKKLVVSKQRLTDKPINVKFNLDNDNDYHELVMVAENLGEIPPNTSLMIVTAGSKQYEVRITSTEQKNAVVIFKYEKDK